MKKKNVKVSVIMSIYNENINWIIDSIESILNQSYRNLEFIIVLDNPDNIEIIELLETYKFRDKRVQVIINEKNIGLIKSLNKAILNTSGELIARMDADDISYLNRLEEQVNFLNNNPTISLVGCKIEYINENNKLIKKESYRAHKHEEIKELLKYANMFAHPSLMYRKQAIIDIGLYKNALYAEDYELIIEFVLNGYKVANINDILLKYRLRKNGVSTSKRPYQFITCDYLQQEYINNINENNYEFSEKKLKILYEKKAGRYIKFIDKIYDKYVEGINNSNHIKSYINLLLCMMLSSIYRRNILNRITLKKKIKNAR